MKKLVALVCVLGMFAVLLSGCYPALLDTTMTVGLDGSGIREFVVYLLKDGTVNPDDDAKTVEGMFTDPGYFPKGAQAAVDYLNDLRPDFLTELVLEELDDRYMITFSMDFTSMEDFNTKMLALSADLDWTAADIAEATLESAVGETQTVYTYTEDVAFVNIGALWMSTALWESPQDADKIFSVEYAQGQFNWEKHYNDADALQYAMFFTHSTTINLDGEEENFGEDAEAVTVSKTVDNPEPTSTPEPTAAPTTAPTATPTPEPESPQTADPFTASAVVLAVFAAGSAALVLKKKR